MKSLTLINTYFKYLVVCGIILIMGYSCKTKNPIEETQYKIFLSNLSYKSYKTVSENTIPPLVLLYNNTSNTEDIEISEEVLRLLLGYYWVMNNYSEKAIAENNIVLEISSDKRNKMLAHSLQSICMSENGWTNLAQDESDFAKSFLNSEPKNAGSTLDKMTYHLLLGTLSVYNENYQNARFHFAGFGIVSQIHWPYELAEALADFKDEKNEIGLSKINAIIKNELVPKEVANNLLISAKKISNDSKIIDPKIFWSKEISLSLFKEMEKTDIQGMQKIAELIVKLSEKFKSTQDSIR
ncbi:MAG TPA: hypothetical protein PLC59_01715 [Bacteroidales bacterium]|nr:hypothetical protein [Bacteroidales bacterium]HQI44784.1 hypothetical protein [Bacteroidales bacterium]